MLIKGSCHCGNIGFELAWEPDPVEINARACGCSFCVKHGGVWTSNPAGRVRISVRDRSLVNDYTFGTRTATFHTCTRCGVVPVVTSLIDGRLYAVVSVNAMNGLDPAMVKRAPISFEGEDLDVRLARRKRGWIGDVAFVADHEAVAKST